MTELTPDSATCERWFRWWSEARTGNPEAETQLLGEVRPFFKRVAQSQCGGRSFGPWDASDVVQECCLKLSKLLPDHERGAAMGPTFRAWLQTMAVNEFRDALRAGNAQMRGGGRRIGPLPQSPSGEEVLAADASTPSQQVMRQEEQERLKAALERLPADHQEVVRLRCSEQLTWAEIAQRMGRTEDAVKKLFERVFRRLRDDLKD